NDNPTGGLKVRGGVNLVSRLSDGERSRGVIAASTGNHGQSVAYASRLFGLSAIICAPAAANPVKVEAMQDLGAEVILEGERYDDSRRNAERLAREHGYRYIHSGDEPLLIAGVGTHTLEVLQEQPRIDTVIVPIGGGSGAAGGCISAKAINPEVQVIGVQSEQAQAAYLSWKNGELIESPNRRRDGRSREGVAQVRPLCVSERDWNRRSAGARLEGDPRRLRLHGRELRLSRPQEVIRRPRRHGDGPFGADDRGTASVRWTQGDQ